MAERMYTSSLRMQSLRRTSTQQCHCLLAFVEERIIVSRSTQASTTGD
ncbi:hypothetical protein T4D_11290 [Trichinella pseudospiralis]|uniref:Uncharacterized protein n=1 Tax=Trichinella pseudospiralis TaxID=6337 RepID=A0A0V1FM97_TRIPS|nr:hypothetical protein T4D_11290 [Trichinella pseudospiralis]